VIKNTFGEDEEGFLVGGIEDDTGWEFSTQFAETIADL
jgi:hypothetical protein